MTDSFEKSIPSPVSRFVQVVCNECGNRMTVFDSAKTTVRCSVCGAVVAKPTGGKSIIYAKKEKVLE
ncbi:MAG: 30S ribosomal protein S27e [Candidatus Caldarchaeum sp.]|nr:30S ribosomal protein S27e [Candidatus Caldarchaeum sp.]MDW7977800.1 30S ribosomal protein S27e [Candidatus Caldarchaeum sp.]MDW8360256.1 30S ribosomal protein S27e [Candidatus Caldarchaeum sp.]